MLHFFWHLNSVGPLPGMIAGAAWHVKGSQAAELAVYIALTFRHSHFIRRIWFA